MVAVSAQPPDLRRRSLGREGFAVTCPLALLGSASDPIRVPRLADSLPASFSRLLTVAALRLAWVATTHSPEDLHLQVTFHAGHTRRSPVLAYADGAFVLSYSRAARRAVVQMNALVDEENTESESRL